MPFHGRVVSSGYSSSVSGGSKAVSGSQRDGSQSVGSSLGDVVTLEDTLESIIGALHNLATSSKRVARRSAARFAKKGQYFHINFDQGRKDITIAD